VIDNRAKELNAVSQRLLSPTLFRAQLRVGKRSLHRGGQSNGTVLQEIVRGPVSHGFDGDFLADRPGHQYQRHVQARRAQHFQSAKAPESGNRIIRENDVGRRAQGSEKIPLGFDSRPLPDLPSLLYLAVQELCVVHIILDKQRL
jgi:hypothetical protein